jgi:hypothetical protein
VTVCCENLNEPSGSRKGKEFLDQVGGHQLLNKKSVHWSYLISYVTLHSQSENEEGSVRSLKTLSVLGPHSPLLRVPTRWVLKRSIF